MQSAFQPQGALPAGFLLASRYRIEKQIGEGGFSIVYRALDLDRRMTVAIKQISLSGLSPKDMIEATDTYNREVALLTKLKHDNVPRIYDQFTDPEHWYVVMDYIEGQTLEDMLKQARGGHLPVKQVIDIALALCNALHYLHMQRPPIIFRDVKPANIMITPAGRLYLIDFGIARHYREGQRRDTGALGSPGYAAPEQYGKAQTTPKTDIFGMGATLQTLLTGKEPLDIAVDGMPPDLHLPRKLQAMLTRMLDPDAAKRPAIEEVRERLLDCRDDTFAHKAMQGATFAGLLFKSTFGGLSIPILLLALFVFGTFYVASGFNSSPFWLPCVLTNAAVLCLYLAIGLYKGLKVPVGERRPGEIVLSLWEHVLIGLFVSSVLTMMFYFLQDIVQQNPTWILEVGIELIGVCAGLAYAVSKFLPLVQSFGKSYKRGNATHERPIVIQQQMRRTRLW